MKANREAILARLAAANGPVSGNRLACELGISRTAVWKHISALQQKDIHITAYRGRGYVLESDVLNACVLQTKLKAQLLGRPCIVLDDVDSTNSEVMRRAEQGAQEGLVILAERQQAGRGRLQRRWHTLPGDTLAISILLRPPLAPEQVPQLSLLAAVALCDALSPIVPDIRIKWPNDMIHHGKKLAGILTEMRAEPGHVQAVAIGIGVNVRLPEGGWPPDIAHIATDLCSASGRAVSRMEAGARIIDSLDYNYTTYLEKGFEPVRNRWWRAHAACGKPVRVHDGSGYIQGLAEALDEDGALLLRTHSGVQRIIAGDLDIMEEGV